MAIASSLGKLSVEIGGDTAGLDAAHASSSSTLRSMAANTQRAASAMANAFSAMSTETLTSMAAVAGGAQRMAGSTVSSFQSMAAAAATLRNALLPLAALYAVYSAFRALDDTVKDTILSFDQASKAADRLGLSVEQFSNMAFAARVAGVNAQQFEGALKSLTAASQASDDAFAPATRALAAMGISLQNLGDKPAAVERELLKLANRFQAMEEGPNKAALAVALFGASADAMVPFLNRGAAGVAELMAQSQKFGATISGETSKQAVEYTDNMRKLGEINSLVSKAIGQELIASFNSWSKTLIGLAERFEIASRAGAVFRGVLAVMDQTVQSLLLPFRAVTDVVAGLLSALVALGKGDVAAALGHMKVMGDDLAKTFDNFATRTVANVETVIPSLKGLGDTVGLVGEKMNWAATIEKQKAPIMETAEAIRAAMAAAAEQNRIMFMELTRDTAIPLDAKLILLKMSLDNGGISLRQYTEAVRNAEIEQTRLNQAVGQLTMSDLMSDKALPMQEKMNQLNELVRSGAIGWRDYMGAMQDVQRQGVQATNDLMSASSNALTSIFEGNKTAAIASTLINTYQAISKALATYGPTPQGFAMSAIAGAVGFAQVMKIRSTSNSGGGGGGGGSGGGGGGASSAAAAASAPAPAAAAPSAPTNNQTLTLSGLDPRSMFSGEVVRSLASRLIEFQRDGGQVILAR
jgi:hypothetical protein